jgi:hypothetical protein
LEFKGRLLGSSSRRPAGESVCLKDTFYA